MSEEPKTTIEDLIAFSHQRDLDAKKALERMAKEKAEAAAKAQAEKKALTSKKNSEILQAVREKETGRWVTGKSGNPGGRPKGNLLRQAEFARDVLQATDNAKDLLSFLVSTARGEIPGVTVKERMEATKELLNRALGKAPDIIATVDLTENNLFAALNVDELKRLAAGDTEEDEGE